VSAYVCAECGETFSKPSALDGHRRHCDPALDRALSAAYVAGASVAQIAHRFEIGVTRVRAALKRTGTPYRARTAPPRKPKPPPPEPTYAFPGRCEVCLARVDGDASHVCERVRVRPI
jgi:hypothetical protein